MSVHRAIGGAIVTGYGPIGLTEAQRLADFYAAEALHCGLDGAHAAARLCEQRSAGLRTAIAAATLWRRAAGWREPEAADRVW